MSLESLIVLVAITQSLLRQSTDNAGRYLAVFLDVTGATNTFQVGWIVVRVVPILVVNILTLSSLGTSCTALGEPVSLRGNVSLTSPLTSTVSRRTLDPYKFDCNTCGD